MIISHQAGAKYIAFACVLVVLATCGKLSSVVTLNSDAVLAVVRGPTPIPAGEATGENDLTVSNEFFVVSFGVDTSSPWGVASGGILDIGVKRNGIIENDFVSLVDFMPNNWSAWPTSYQRVSIESQSAERVVVLTERDWGEVELETRFELIKGQSRIRITTSMHNKGDATLGDLRSGYIAWPTGGNLFGMPGLAAMDSIPVDDSAAFAKWSASYGRHWSMGLHASDASLVGYGGRDRYWPHSLQAGEKRELSAWLQIEPNANLAAFVAADLDLDSDTEAALSSELQGSITNSNGDVLEDSVLIVRKNGMDYSWALADQGRYSIRLPAGDYQVYPTAAGYGKGQLLDLKLEAGKSEQHDFSDVQSPASVELQINAAKSEQSSPVHSVVSVARGPSQSVQYFGSNRFFTDLDSPGLLKLSLPPGMYDFEISAGAGFISELKEISMQLEAGQQRSIEVNIDKLTSPSDKNWYSADLHHHSDVLDGFTDPEYVMRAQLSAALDLAFLSDHDSTANNAAMGALAEKENMPFIAGTELSASWAHFNAYPIDAEEKVSSSIGSMSVQEIFSEGRRLGADVIHVNHPYGNYGYFSSLELDSSAASQNIVPGGYDPGFDMIEITGSHDEKTRNYAWNLWNQGKPAYFVAGSDVHDVWNVPLAISTGFARTFVHVEGELTVQSYIKNLKAGRSYASQGPLIYPELMFGSEHIHDPNDGALKLNYQLEAVRGLKSVSLIQAGETIDARKLDGLVEAKLEFEVQVVSNSWFSLIVEDQQGRFAHSNPLWVKLAK